MDSPLERVAGLERAGLEAALEPSHPLLGGSMREALRHHVTLRLLLQAVVADGGGRAQRLVDVARLQDLPHALGVVRPESGIAIRLQLLLNGQRVRRTAVR